MYKVISNVETLKQFEIETGNTLSMWRNIPAVTRVREMAVELDLNYGADRDIVADLGGYIVILYGEPNEMEKDFDKVLKYHSLQSDLYESEEKYQSGQNMITIRLYLCSSDYAVVVVTIQ